MKLTTPLILLAIGLFFAIDGLVNYKEFQSIESVKITSSIYIIWFSLNNIQETL